MFKGWREQYDRVLRIFGRVRRGDLNASEIQDDLGHLFQGIFHLKNWLIKSGRLRRDYIQNALNNSDYLKFLRTLVVKVKHFRVDPKRCHNDLDPDIVKQRISNRRASVRIVDGILIPSTARPPIRPEIRPPTGPTTRSSKRTDFIAKTPTLHSRSSGREFSCLEVINRAIQGREKTFRNQDC